MAIKLNLAARRFGQLRRWLLLASLVLPTAHPAVAQEDPPLDGVAAVESCFPIGGTGILSGQVTYPGGSPAQQAYVLLYTADGRFLRSGLADTAGLYSFAGLKAGGYRLQVQPQGFTTYRSEWYNNQSDPVNASTIFVANGTTTINVQLDPGSLLSGRITDVDGNPVTGVAVHAYNAFGMEEAAIGYPDVNGNYALSEGLSSGAYRLEISTRDAPFLPEYYDDQPNLNSATAINVTAPNPVSGLNVVLARSARISGRVTVAGTNDPAPAYVYLDGQMGGESLQTNANGDYTSTASLPSGVYTVYFLQKDPSQNLAGSMQTVTLTAPDTLTLNGTLSSGGQFTGRITGEDGTPLAATVVNWFNDDLASFGSTATDASGVYTATGLATGAYTVLFHRSGYLVEYYDDKLLSSQSNRVSVTANEVTIGIDAALAQGGVISGTVTAADTGLPLTSVRVTVYDRQGDYVTSTSVNAAGQYQASGLPSGSFSVGFEPQAGGISCGYQAATIAPVSVAAPAVTPNVDAVLARGSAILGQVVYATTARPLENVLVSVYDPAGKAMAWGNTNFLGYYITSPALPSGSYRVKFSDDEQGNIDEYYNNQLFFETADWVTVTAPNDLSGISAALIEGGSINGRVTAADTGLGLQNVVVTAYDSSGAEAGVSWTDSDGRYVIVAGLATGNYRLGFAPLEAADLVAALPGPSSPSPCDLPLELSRALELPRLDRLAAAGQCAIGGGYLPQFYSQKFTLAEANTIAVTAPTNTDNVDVVLQRGVFLPIIQR